MGNDNTSASEVSLDNYAGRVCEVLAASSEPGIVRSMGGIVATQGAARSHSRTAVPFARSENGFYLRGPAADLGINKVATPTHPQTKGAYEQKLVSVEVHCIWIHLTYDGLRYYP